MAFPVKGGVHHRTGQVDPECGSGGAMDRSSPAREKYAKRIECDSGPSYSHVSVLDFQHSPRIILGSPVPPASNTTSLPLFEKENGIRNRLHNRVRNAFCFSGGA